MNVVIVVLKCAHSYKLFGKLAVGSELANKNLLNCQWSIF